MKTQTRRLTAVLLCIAMLLSSGLFALAADEPTYDAAWGEYWNSYTEEGTAVTLAPGSNETERYVSWYSPADAKDAKVLVSLNEDMSGAVAFTGTTIETNQGDIKNRVVITGLEAGKDYYYQCSSSAAVTDVYSFSTIESTTFSALYVTDVHISGEEDLIGHSYKWNQVLETAKEKADINLVVSAGDQATKGRRAEYEGFVASPAAKTVSIATSVGNHDIKYTDYKAFHFVPNENTKAGVKNFISGDYWFVKGDALFLMLDSNCQSMTDHRSFIRKAIKANPDVKWRIMMFHHDLYGGRLPNREDENKLLRLLFAPLADEFSIDLVLLGHSHYYTISNVMYGGETVSSTADVSSVTDPNGTIFMVSGSINHPRGYDENDVPPLGVNVGQSYLSKDVIYNILDFTEDSITIKSYTLSDDELFNTFTINKTSQQGGHTKNSTPFYSFFVRFIADVYAFFDMIGRSFGFYFDNVI